MTHRWWTFAPAISLLGVATPAVSQDPVEEILAYDVSIVVSDGGSMRVSESIEVRALGQAIRRGIYRDFPTRFPRAGGGGRIVAPFEVLSVTRDGQPEPYSLEQITGVGGRGGIRVRIGDPDVFVSRGVHTYVMVYETARWVQFGSSEDRVYWNVTGNGWEFPIASASARVTLRTPGLQPLELTAWTGPDGSVEQAATWLWDASSGTAVFETTSPLATFEGLTISMTVPSGAIVPPSAEQTSQWFRLDWGGYLEAAPTVALIVVAYLLMWIRVGRDPPRGPTVVEYEPPEGFSAASLGYIERRGHRPDQLNAALVSLAVKGALTIEQDGRKWHLRSTDTVPEGLAGEEERLLRKLFRKKGSLTLSGTSNSRLRKGVTEFRKGLQRDLEGRYFVNNRRWFMAGLVLSVIGFALLAWRARFAVSPEIWFMGFWLTFWTVGVATLLFRTGRLWGQAFSGDPFAWIGAIFMTLFSAPFLAAEVFVGYTLFQGAPGHLSAAALAIGLTNVGFYHLLERPTLVGRGVLDRLEGFRRYLGATETDVYERLQPVDGGLELFERFLPYAIALGVGNRWAERFEGVLTPQQTEGAGGPRWYSGGSEGGLTSMASALGDSFSSSLSASSAAPSSGGSGGGGGGSSGGGGGGGGGGGW